MLNKETINRLIGAGKSLVSLLLCLLVDTIDSRMCFWLQDVRLKGDFDRDISRQEDPVWNVGSQINV